MTGPLLMLLTLGWLLPPALLPTVPRMAAPATERAAEALFREAGLAGVLDTRVFVAGYRDMERHGLQARMLAIADMTQPSTAQRLVIVDLETRQLVLRTWPTFRTSRGRFL